MRPPASASENRTHGAEKIGLSRYSDFLNNRPFSSLAVMQQYGSDRVESGHRADIIDRSKETKANTRWT